MFDWFFVLGLVDFFGGMVVVGVVGCGVVVEVIVDVF